MASTEPYFGPEVVDRDAGGEFVRELKAATAFIVGTAPIHEVHATAEARAPYINKKVLIRKREDISVIFGPARDGYTLPQALDAMFDQAEDRGIGTICVVNVFDPDVHKDGANAPDPSLVSNLDIVGEFDAAGVPSGMKLAYSCFQSFGWFPKIMLVPGFSGLVGVKAEGLVISNRIRSRFLHDGLLGVTPQQAIEARGAGGLFDWQSSSPRHLLLWPHMMAINMDDTSDNAGKAVAEPYSARFAGVMLRTVVEHGYHHSPSNRRIECEAAAQDVLYIPGDMQSDVQLLRGAGIITCEERWGKGPHTSGNRSAAYPTVTDMRNFIHVQYIEDVMDEAILFFLDEWKDRNANPASIELIEDKINAWLGTKMTGSDPTLYDGRFFFDRQKTTPETVADGWLFWKLDYVPVGIMERLTVERWINIDLIRNALGLATSTPPNIAA
jgi:phage tail sheath protein FI